MRRAAAHHGSQSDDRLKAPGCGQAFGGDGDLEGAGHLHDAHVIVWHAVLGEGCHGAFQQRIGDGCVEARRNDGEACAVNRIVRDRDIVVGHETICRKHNIL
jgi:hypothetical protein